MITFLLKLIATELVTAIALLGVGYLHDFDDSPLSMRARSAFSETLVLLFVTILILVWSV